MKENKEWKDIVGFPSYQVNPYGKVRRWKGGKWVEVKGFESETSKGSYLVVVITDDNGCERFRGCHQLSCTAFNSPPPTENHVVNHKDGDKHNNHFTNLEWTTRSDNTLHALKAGLRDDNVPVIVKDTLTGESVEHYSIIELSRQWNLPRYEIYSLIGRHRETPYKDRWLFEIDMERVGLVERVNRKSVMAFDHVLNKWIISPSLNVMTAATGVSPCTISGAIWGDLNNPMAGYTFKEYPSDGTVEPLPVETALKQRKKYMTKAPSKRSGVIVYNASTNQETFYGSRKEVEEAIPCFSKNRLISYFAEQRNTGKIKLYLGFMLKLPDDERPFPKVTDLQVDKSIKGVRPWTLAFDVVGENGDVERVYGASRLASKLNVARSIVDKIKTESSINGYTVKLLVE